MATMPRKGIRSATGAGQRHADFSVISISRRSPFFCGAVVVLCPGSVSYRSTCGGPQIQGMPTHFCSLKAVLPASFSALDLSMSMYDVSCSALSCFSAACSFANVSAFLPHNQSRSVQAARTRYI